MTRPSLQDVLFQRISKHGKVTFAEFMELALYWPNGGYYPRLGVVTPPQDYYTAPMAHPAFGALIALQLEEMWRLVEEPSRFTVVEQGAGTGRLAADIRDFSQHLDPSFHRALQYIGVDRVGGAAPFSMEDAAVSSIVGCILSNELLDAFPVHRVTVRNGKLLEIYLTQQEGRLVELLDNVSTDDIHTRLESEDVHLVEGQVAEVCLELEPWARQAAKMLQRGFVLTIDYGHPSADLYDVRRPQGTLRCYYRHTLTGNPYQRIGEQDITAHVDFTAVASLGRRYGLEPYPLLSQAGFLSNLGLPLLMERLYSENLGQRERDANRMAMLELARPGGMGDFKVLAQRKGTACHHLSGVHGASKEWGQRVRGLPLPRLSRQHVDLLAARYPHASEDWEQLWR